MILKPFSLTNLNIKHLNIVNYTYKLVIETVGFINYN